SLGNSILKSTSVTATVFGALGAVLGAELVGAVVVARPVLGFVVVAGGGGGGGDAAAPVVPPSARLSLGSRPKKKTANIIPTNSVTVRVRKAGRPRRPG